MRSFVKLTIAVFIFLLFPIGISGFFVGLKGDMSLILSQIMILATTVLIFLIAFKASRGYEEKTIKLIGEADSLEDLKSLRDKRISYKSKANITREILLKYPSKEEAERLKKYTTDPKDMENYYSAYIKNADSDKREEYKIRRDNFLKKYRHKMRVYPDFKENLKTAIKWLGIFFLAAFLTSLIGRTLIKSQAEFIIYFLIQMVLLAAYMINTIIWLSRTVRSYWDKIYI